MEDVYYYRRRNLQRLCLTKHADNQSATGRFLGVEPNLVNRWLRGSKQIGTEVAREVEKKYNLEKGWMDKEHRTDEESALIDAYRKASDDRRSAVRLLLDVKVVNPDADLSSSNR